VRGVEIRQPEVPRAGYLGWAESGANRRADIGL
jgi:hypothetical protein